MTLESKTLAELVELREKLVKAIQHNPAHTRIEQVELDDVNQWIALRTQGPKRATVPEPRFDVGDK